MRIPPENTRTPGRMPKRKEVAKSVSRFNRKMPDPYCCCIDFPRSKNRCHLHGRGVGQTCNRCKYVIEPGDNRCVTYSEIWWHLECLNPNLGDGGLRMRNIEVMDAADELEMIDD